MHIPIMSNLWIRPPILVEVLCKFHPSSAETPAFVKESFPLVQELDGLEQQSCLILHRRHTDSGRPGSCNVMCTYGASNSINLT